MNQHYAVRSHSLYNDFVYFKNITYVLSEILKTSVFIIVILILSNFIPQVKSELCSSYCATDFCVPLYGVQDPLFNTQVYVIQNNVKLMFPDNTYYKLEADPNGTPTLSCSGNPMCNQICSVNGSVCAGDTTFCGNRACNQNSECYCIIGNAAFHIYVEYNASQFLVLQTDTALLQACTSFEQINNKRAIEQANNTNSTIPIAQCSIYTVTVSDSEFKLTILPPFEDMGYLKILYHGETKIYQLTETTMNFLIPPTWASTTGDITLEFNSHDQYCFTTYPIVAKYQCEMKDCFWCMNFYSNYRCLPQTYQSIIFWGTFLFVVVVLFMAPFVGYLLYLICIIIFELFKCCFSYSTKFHKTKIMKKVYLAAYSRTKNVKEYLQTDEENIPVDETVYMNQHSNLHTNMDISETKHTKSSLDKKKQKLKTKKDTNTVVHIQTEEPEKQILGYVRGRPIYARNALFLICLLCFCHSSFAACGQGASIGSSQTTCLANGTTQVCTENYNILSTIPTTGSQYCFALTSNGSTVWTGYIQHLGMTATLSLTLQYYTSAWNGFSQSAHWCDGTSKCSGGCSGVQSTRTAGGALTDTRLNLYPGTTLCHNSCGCVTCDGCFLCSPSCLFSGYGIIPTGTVYQVYAISSIVYTPSILVSVTGPSVTLNQIISPTTTAFMVGNFSVQLIGSFTPPQISLSNMYVIRALNTQNYYFTSAAQLNQITSGIPGDIQSSTSTGLTGTPASFKIGSIVTTSQGDLGDTYIFPASGVSSTFSTWSKIPTTIGGNIWTLSSSNVLSNITNAPALAISMQTPTGLKFSRTVNVVCPSFAVTNASGCFSCDSGSIISIMAYSTCSAGAVTVTISDFAIIVFTPGITLSTSPTIYQIAIQTPVASNSFDIILSSSYSTARKSVTFTAVEVTRVVNNNDTFTNDTILSPSSGSPALQDFLKFSTSAGGIITWIIIAIVIVIALVLLFPLFLNIVKSALSPPKKD